MTRGCSSYYTEAGKIVNQARGLGIDQTIVGPDGFGDAKFVEQATPAAATNVSMSGFQLLVNCQKKLRSLLKHTKLSTKKNHLCLQLWL